MSKLPPCDLLIPTRGRKLKRAVWSSRLWVSASFTCNTVESYFSTSLKGNQIQNSTESMRFNLILELCSHTVHILSQLLTGAPKLWGCSCANEPSFRPRPSRQLHSLGHTETRIYISNIIRAHTCMTSAKFLDFWLEDIKLWQSNLFATNSFWQTI